MPFLAVKRFSFNHSCPKCRSAPRHRAHQILYRDVLHFDHKKGSVLYFAPERNLDYFRQLPNLEVHTSNYPAGEADFHIDILAIPFADSSWDFVICHHVIEHLSDDRKGLREMLRILKPGGEAIVSVPMDLGRQTTVEYGTANPAEHYHYYSYGTDFIERVPDGFGVSSFRVSEFCSELQQQQHALEDEVVYVLKKLAN
jgi:SAM-dependent methyltransferase